MILPRQLSQASMRIIIGSLILSVALIVSCAPARAACERSWDGKTLRCSAELLPPDASSFSRPTSPALSSDDVISLEACKRERGGFSGIYKASPDSIMCLSRPFPSNDGQDRVDSSPNDGRVRLVERYNCKYGDKIYDITRYIVSEEKPDIDTDGSTLNTWCILGKIDPKTMVKAPPASVASPPDRPSTPDTNQAPAVKRSSPAREPLAPAPPSPQPDGYAPAPPGKLALPDLQKLPPAPVVNPFKPPAIIAKAQKQPIPEACVAVIESHKVSSMCDFTSGIAMYANDIRIPAQYARECPSPIEFTFVNPHDGKENVEYATPRRHIVYSCGAPIRDVTVR